ncbi:MAG: ribonuclease HII [Ignavibacteriaceae bacterium]|nr:ribonuclease HII [Ignavibacteriaceae bacterium]
MRHFDNLYRNSRIQILAGTDEAGRGPLAGPVVAAAVVFAPETFIPNVNDSKKLSAKQREELYPYIIEKCLDFSVTIISNIVIDRINILQASLMAMKKSINKLKVTPDLILIDGNKSFEHKIPTLPIIKGDSKSFSIAAASIIAKVTRDKLMLKLNEKHPEYLWSKNKGYPTKEHINAIKLFGLTEFHRRSFVKNIIDSSFDLKFTDTSDVA